MSARGGALVSLVPALALALVAPVAGCGAGRPAGPPRSTCAEAAASITQGLRRAAPADAERAADLEPRFARACRSSGWRPNVVRCFALARDPDEHRICARRLEPAQRDEARVIQGALYATRGPRGEGRRSSEPDACRDLATARDALLACDVLPPPFRVELANELQNTLSHVDNAGTSPELKALCTHMVDEVHRILASAGC